MMSRYLYPSLNSLLFELHRLRDAFQTLLSVAGRLIPEAESRAVMKVAKATVTQLLVQETPWTAWTLWEVVNFLPGTLG